MTYALGSAVDVAGSRHRPPGRGTMCEQMYADVLYYGRVRKRDRARDTCVRSERVVYVHDTQLNASRQREIERDNDRFVF